MLTRIATIVTAAELPIVLAIAPLLMFPSGGRVAAGALVPVVWTCAWMATGRFVPRTPLNWALGLLLVMVGISLVATFDVGFSLGKVSGVALGVALFWALARWTVTPARLRLAVACFSLGGAGLAAIGLLGTQGARKFPALQTVVDLAARIPMIVRGLPGAEDGFNPNAVAGALVLFLPLQLALLTPSCLRWLRPSPDRRASGWLIASQGAVFVVTALAAVLMQSRGAWAGLGAAGFVLLAWMGRRMRRVVLGAGAFAILVGLAVGLDPARESGGWPSDQGIANHVLLRAELWSNAVEAIRDAPLTGIGMNAFRAIQPARYALFPVASAPDIAHAHNHLLQAALDLGLPGLVSYLAIWVLAGTLLVRAARQATDPALRLVSGGLAAGLAAQFVFGLTDAIPLGAKVGACFWCALGLVVGLQSIVRLPRDGDGTGHPDRTSEPARAADD